MKYHRQIHFGHDPKSGVYGDCARTVLACLLDFEDATDIPHFAEIAGDDETQCLKLIDAWLGERGLRRILFAADTTIEYLNKAMSMWNPGVPYCLVGKTSRGHVHVAIYKNGTLLHDPHPSDEGITAPTDDGHYWVEIIASVPNTSPVSAEADAEREVDHE